MSSPSKLDNPRYSHGNEVPETSDDEGTIIDYEEDSQDENVPLGDEWQQAWENYFERNRKRQSNEIMASSPL